MSHQWTLPRFGKEVLTLLGLLHHKHSLVAITSSNILLVCNMKADEEWNTGFNFHKFSKKILLLILDYMHCGFFSLKRHTDIDFWLCFRPKFGLHVVKGSSFYLPLAGIILRRGHVCWTKFSTVKRATKRLTPPPHIALGIYSGGNFSADAQLCWIWSLCTCFGVLGSQWKQHKAKSWVSKYILYERDFKTL